MPPKKSELATTQSNEMVFNEETIDLIKKTVAVGASDNELKLFLYQASRTKLDPLARQIYFIKRGDKVTIQTSIDGFRIVAERSGNYAGQDEPEYVVEEGKMKACKVRVYKFGPSGQRYQAAVGVAYWTEYVPMYNGKVGAMWQKMPHNMLAKVAEALALRKAFPQDLSGLYTSEEMEQDRVVETSTQPPLAEQPTQAATAPKPTPQKTAENTVADAEVVGSEQIAEAAYQALENDNPEPTKQLNEHTCKVHIFKGEPALMKDRGKGIWDHRAKGTLRPDGSLDFNNNGSWYYCQGQGWKLAPVQK